MRLRLVSLLLLSTWVVAFAPPSVTSAQPKMPWNGLRTYAIRAEPLGRIGDVDVRGDGVGSALAAVPGKKDEFYGLSDRGPNAEGPEADSKIFPYPDYQPSIAHMRIRGATAEIVSKITLRDASGVPLSGLVPPRDAGSTGEIAYDAKGARLESSALGIDPEGLVALADGTFWISEEYAPSIVHFAADGKMIERVTPFSANDLGHRLPAVLAKRIPNRGLEALAVSPDGKTLVLLMQSAVANGITTSDAKKTALVRIVTYTIATGATKTFVYLLEDPATKVTMTSDIAALNATEFVVIEQDIKYPGADAKEKSLFAISLDGASEVGAAGSDESLEHRVAGLSTADATTKLDELGIRPVRKRLLVDLLAVLRAADPTGKTFAHDKVEGVAVLDGGKRLVLSNDCDFGVGATSPPSRAFAAKTVPATGKPDFGELLVLDLDKLQVHAKSRADLQRSAENGFSSRL